MIYKVLYNITSRKIDVNSTNLFVMNIMDANERQRSPILSYKIGNMYSQLLFVKVNVPLKKKKI